MNTLLSLKLKAPLKKQLEKRAKELKLAPTDFIIKALEDYFYFEQVNKLRVELKQYALRMGFKNEEDIFKKIS